MLYHPGPNPTVDIIVTKKIETNSKESFQVLFIRRSKNAAAEPGKWAFPGGFIDTTSCKGESWLPGMETEIAAAKRELLEETGLDLSHYDDKTFQFLGVYDSLERDPRNTLTHWIESHVFTIQINENEGDFVEGLDDAEDARWFILQEILNMKKDLFAFDHFAILKEHMLIDN